MRVLLTRPNSRTNMAPVPLGLGYVAESLRRQRGHGIHIVDGRLDRLSVQDIGHRARHYRPDVVGISSTVMDIAETHALARVLRHELPRAKIIAGGAYASSAPEMLARDPYFDAIVIGEGEETTVELLDAFACGQRDLSGVAGIAYQQDGVVHLTAPRAPIENLDDYRPAWDLLDPTKYYSLLRHNSHSRIRKDPRMAPLFTSRGCPFHCIFCHNVFGKKTRYMSPDAVLDEMTLLRDRYGVREIEFHDDAFNQDRDRAKEIFRRVIDRNVGIHLAFPNGLRADRLDDELVDLFCEGGVFRISYAIEAASPRVHKLIKKHVNFDKMNHFISLTASRGIFTVGFFILGFPTETAAEMQDTVDFACKSDLHYASFFYLTPHPGTEVATMSGIDHQKIDYSDYSEISCNLSAVGNAELHKIVKRAYRRFYLDPVRIARIARVTPKNVYILTNAVMLARLLFQDGVAR